MGKEILRTNKYGIFNIVVYCLFHDSISSVKPGKHTHICTRTHTHSHLSLAVEPIPAAVAEALGSRTRENSLILSPTGW